ncbi:MAG: polyprenyl synthetase family protein [Bacteroidales bacterium]|jgi:geranylgeranyl diphosphate synthase type II|nr:polyprenyl synthetase family protein [Bacteroidales bacterium]
MLTYKELLEKYSKSLNEESFPGKPVELYEPIKYMMDIGGKRLRPVLLLMACEAFGGKLEKAMPAAHAIEIFHNFTLVHDDIMDGARIRRGKDSIWKIWGEDTAILVGDTMFAMAIEYLIKTDHPKKIEMAEAFLKVAKEVCEGQQLDMNYEEEDDITIPDYLTMIKLKTAVLLATALQIGAMFGNAGKEDLQNIYDFGINIGMAFQLKDDLLDVFGNVDKFGKMPGGDILSDKKTFLLLKALAIANKKDKEIILNYVGEGDDDPEQKIMDITAIYAKLNLDKITITEMERLFERAEYHMEKVSLPEEKKAELLSIAQKMMYRDN